MNHDTLICTEMNEKLERELKECQELLLDFVEQTIRCSDTSYDIMDTFCFDRAQDYLIKHKLINPKECQRK